MEKRPLPDRQREWLHAELDHWSQEGLVTPEQRAGILDLYESKGDVSRKKQSHGVFVLQSIGMSLFGLAFLLLVGFNWEYLAGGMRIIIVVGAMLVAHGIGYWLRWTRNKPMAGQIATFLGCFLFGCGIWQIAQVFHINSENADGVWLWALGILPFALFLESALLHAFLVVILATWVGTEMLGIGSSRWWGWWRVPSGCYTLPLMAAPGILWAYRRNSVKTLAMYLPLVAWWLILLPISWNRNLNPVYFMGAVAAIFLAFAETHRIGDPKAALFRLYGAVVTVGLLFLMGFMDFQREMQGHLGGWTLVQASLILVFGLGLIALLNQWGSPHPNDSPDFFKRYIQRFWLPSSLIVMFAALSLWNLFSGFDRSEARLGSSLGNWTFAVLIPCVAVNVATVTMAIWLMRVGLREDRGRPFGGGVMLFLTWAVVRYVDLFGAVGGMIGAALMFSMCGVGLFSLARFWSQRKESTE